MPRKFLKRHLPDPERLKARKELRPLARLLEDPYLLHLNRRSVATGLAAGVFVAFLPTIGQMLLAAALAILLRGNVLIAAAAVWITNPLTTPALLYASYRIGSWLLGGHELPSFSPSAEWLLAEIGIIWKPLLLGSLILGAVCAVAAYYLAHLAWRLRVLRSRAQRRQPPRPRQDD